MENEIKKPVHGAFIDNEYIPRTKKVVGVDMSDLRGLLEIDAWESSLSIWGQFLFVGAFWLGAEKFVEQGITRDTQPLLVVCFMGLIVGIILFWISRRMRKMKRDRIEEIITETKGRI
jgi:hypothetical protein